MANNQSAGDAQGSESKGLKAATIGSGAIEPGPLHLASDLSNPGNMRVAESGPGQFLSPDQVRKLVGTEDQYVKAAPAQLRQELGLPASASSEAVYQKMAQEFVKAFAAASPELQKEGLERLGIDRSQAKNADTVFDAMVRADKKLVGLPDSADFQQLETAKHHYDYHHMMIDFD